MHGAYNIRTQITNYAVAINVGDCMKYLVKIMCVFIYTNLQSCFYLL